MKYPQCYDGDWIKPLMSKWKIKCCDCSLVHVLKFKVTRHGKRNCVMVRVHRDARATAAARRKKK